MSVKLSILTVVKDNPRELLATLQSIQSLHDLADSFKINLSIECIIKDGSTPLLFSIGYLNSVFYNLDIKLIGGKDAGIYQAMDIAFNHSLGEYVTFLNAGDLILTDNYLAAYCSLFSCPLNTILCGYTTWSTNATPGIPLRLDRLIGINPMLGRLPNHQAMFIPRVIQQTLGFDYRFPISGDKDFKIRASQLFRYSSIPLPIVKSLAGGRSQSIKNYQSLFNRTSELFRLMNKNFNPIHAFIYAILFFMWNSRKLWLSK